MKVVIDDVAHGCVRFTIGGRGWLTTMEVSRGKFRILKGSTVKPVCDSFRNTDYGRIRERLECDCVIVGGEFTCDYEFHSAGQAGSVASSAYIATGRAWVADDGRTFAEVFPRRKGERRDFGRPAASAFQGPPKLGPGRTAEGTLTWTQMSGDGEWYVEFRGGNRPFFPSVQVRSEAVA